MIFNLTLTDDIIGLCLFQGALDSLKDDFIEWFHDHFVKNRIQAVIVTC